MNVSVIMNPDKEKEAKTATGGKKKKKVLLEIFQNSQENICDSVFFKMKLQVSDQRTSFLQNTSWRLLLEKQRYLMNKIRLFFVFFPRF